MKKYIVIGNPIDHSLSPKLHNYWLKKNNIDAVYEKRKIITKEIGFIISQLKEKKISGINVTVPFKNEIIPFLDQLSLEAKKTKSVNTIYLDGEKAIGHNTDVEGFKLAIEELKVDLKNKNILILGAGGVVPSLILALSQMNAAKIMISNRTKKRADNLKNAFNNIEIVNWGDIPETDMIINATSVGLNKEDKLDLNFSKIRNKFFFDVIYNPRETNFLKKAKSLGNKCENGKLMFIYQGQAAFKIWHNLLPLVSSELITLLEK